MSINQTKILLLVLLFNCIFSNKINHTLTELGHHDNSFNSTLSTKSDVFLVFYSPECSKCQKYENILHEIENKFNSQNQQIKIAKVDINKEQNKLFIEEFNIEDDPTFVFISHGDFFFYTGKKNSKGFTKFLTKELNYTIPSEQELKDSNVTSAVNGEVDAVLLLVVNGKETKNVDYIKVRRELESIAVKVNFVWTENQELVKQFNVAQGKNELVVYNILDNEGKLDQGNKISTNNLKKNLIHYLSAVFEEARTKNIDQNLYKSISTAIVFYSAEKKEIKDAQSPINTLFNELNEVVQPFRGNLIFYKSNIKKEKIQGIYEIFNFKPEDLPTAVIFDTELSGEEEAIKFKFPAGTKLTKESFLKFLNDYQSKALNKFTASEEIPTNKTDSNGILKIVRNSFEQDISQSKKQNLVLFCIKDTKRCVESRKRFEEIARRLSHSNLVTFGEYDPIHNENDLVHIKKVPEIVLFPQNWKAGQDLVRYSGNYTTTEILDFIKSNAKEESALNPAFDEKELKELAEENHIKQHKLDHEEEEEEVNEEENDEEEEKGEDPEEETKKKNEL